MINLNSANTVRKIIEVNIIFFLKVAVTTYSLLSNA